MTNDKLKSISKLLNMYYEVNEQSPKNVNKYNLRKSTVYRLTKLKEEILSSNNNLKDENLSEKKKIKNIFDEQKYDKDKEENECKSAHSSYLIKEYNISGSKRYTYNIEDSMVRRGLSSKKDLKKGSYTDRLRIGGKYGKSSKTIKNQLKFICSNFYNIFKI